MQFPHFVTVLFLTYIIHAQAKINAGTLEGALKWGETSGIQKSARLGEGRYLTGGLDVAHKHISLHGSQFTEIELNDSINQKAIFVGEEAHISLQSLRFKPVGNLVAVVERQSQLLFEDSTLIGTTIKNSFEVNGGELVLTNLKMEFENVDERRVSNLVIFGESGGYLNVLKTSIDNIMTDGDRPLFGDGHASEITLTKCKFNQINIGHSSTSNFANNIIGQENVIIQDCSFIEVENVLMGGVVNGLNSNGNLQVIGSSFKSCHNTKHISEKISNKEYHTDILSGDASFSGVTFEDCTSQDFGGSIYFVSNGKLSISSTTIKGSQSYGGKGGAIYFEGNGKLSISSTTFKECRSLGQLIGQGGAIYIEGNGEISFSSSTFTECQAFGLQIGQGGAIYIEGDGKHWISSTTFKECLASGKENSEGGSMYSKGGQNKLSSTTFKQSLAFISESQSSQSNIDADQSKALGGALMVVDWKSGSSFSSVQFTTCVAGSGGGIYLASASGRIKFEVVSFKENTASIAGGGGIYAQDTKMIYLRYCTFSGNQGYGNEYGNDLHFSELGVETEQPDMLQIKKDMIYRSKSKSVEPRVYIADVGPQIDWLPDHYEGEWPVWGIVLLQVTVVIVIIIIIVLSICCCYKCCGLCCGSCCGALCGVCCCRGCSDCCNNCCKQCCCQCGSKDGSGDNDQCCSNSGCNKRKGRKAQNQCCAQGSDQCCCCSKSRTADSSNSNYQQRTAEEGRYYDKEGQQSQQRNGDGIAVVVADNKYDLRYGAQQPYAAYQIPAYQYPQQNQPPLPPPLQHNNPQVQQNSYSPQQQFNPMYQQPPPQNQQLPYGKEDFLQ